MNWSDYEILFKKWLKDSYRLYCKIYGDTLLINGDYNELIEEFLEVEGISYEESINDVLLIDLNEEYEFWEEFVSYLRRNND